MFLTSSRKYIVNNFAYYYVPVQGIIQNILEPLKLKTSPTPIRLRVTRSFITVLSLEHTSTTPQLYIIQELDLSTGSIRIPDHIKRVTPDLCIECLMRDYCSTRSGCTKFIPEVRNKGRD